MAKLHGRYAPPTADRSNDPGADPTTPGFKATRRRPGGERVEPTARIPEQPDFRGVAAAKAATRAEQKAAHVAATRADIASRVAARAAEKAARPKFGVEGRPKFGSATPLVTYTKKGKPLADWTGTAPVRVQIITQRKPRFEIIPPTRPPSAEVLAARAALATAAAPNLDHLKRENAIPATPPKPNGEPQTVTVNTNDLTPEQQAAAKDEYREWKRKLRTKEALAMQDPRAEKTTNASLHVVDTPGGVAKYHADRQRTALEIAKGTKGADRKFALALAKEHGAAKRAAGGGGGGVGQKRVPAGQTTGGQWTK